MGTKNKNAKSFRTEKTALIRAAEKRRPVLHVKRNLKSSSSLVHTPRTKVSASHRSRTRNFYRNIYAFSKRTVLTIIILAMLVVILAVLFQSFATPERTVKNKIEDIAENYYENYFYDTIKVTEDRPIEKIMERYVTPGFSQITLRNLLLRDDKITDDTINIISKYCDIEATTIHIYPDPPFGKTDYHIDYRYACNF